MPKYPIQEVADPSLLTDADWAELNKLKAAHESGGSRAVSKAIARLSAEDPIACARLLAALFPEMMRERAKDALADAGAADCGGSGGTPGRHGAAKGTISHQCPC
jgi:hypothetical protein